MEAVRTLIVADDVLVRHGLTSLLASRAELHLVDADESQEIELGTEGREGASQPVVLLDGALSDAMEPLRDWTERGFAVVTLIADVAGTEEARAAGARGVVSRDAPVERLVAAILAVSQGLTVTDPQFAPSATSGRPAREARATDYDPLDEPLTPRESEVLQLLAEGLANKQVAGRLGISEHTAKFHVNSILQKMNAKKRVEAVVRATKLGLLSI